MFLSHFFSCVNFVLNHNISLLNKFFLSESKSYIFIYIFIRLLSVLVLITDLSLLYTSVSVLIWCRNRYFFLLYRFFIENKYHYVKLTAVVIFTTIFNAFCTSFRFVLRAENNDCLVALLAFVFAFATKAVVCSSACFGIYEKIPFLFRFL